MKNSISIFASIFIAIVVTACSSPAEKLENAQINLNQAQADFNKAQDDHLIDVENYKKETAAKIAANDKSIAEFKSRIENEKNDARIEYQKKITALEQKNSDSKKKLDEYKVEGKEQWESFKAEFSRDMEELGNAFKDLVIVNKN